MIIIKKTGETTEERWKNMEKYPVSIVPTVSMNRWIDHYNHDNFSYMSSIIRSLDINYVSVVDYRKF